MEYSLLGPTGVKLSRICVGTATFSVAPDEQESDNCLSAKEERSAAYPRRAPAAHRERLDATPCNDQQASKRLVRLRARPSQREGQGSNPLSSTNGKHRLIRSVDAATGGRPL